MRLGEAWRQACRRIDRLDARLLLEHVCGCSHADLIARPELEIAESRATRLEELLRRRESGEPLAYLLGSAWFCGLEFNVGPAVLIPRPDTEVLVNVAAEKAIALESPAIVDLGTGSGIVAILIARLCPRAQVTAVDVSSVALDVARVNAQRHGVNIRFREGDWYAPLGDERFDLIVSNPPYVVAGDPHLQQNGLPFEPIQALTDGIVGGDGLACIRRLIDGASAHLHTGGWLLMEHGYDQAVEVRRLLAQAGFAEVASWRDSAGIERVSGGRA
ncbi:MAG: peptide chain release factor N(5)-glutamine methyltransferase [Propionivibrio sp.]|nr:peptide chain release factor N(5)-glutamine methyltransferase [Propionivibrio sp.]